MQDSLKKPGMIIIYWISFCSDHCQCQGCARVANCDGSILCHNTGSRDSKWAIRQVFLFIKVDILRIFVIMPVTLKALNLWSDGVKLAVVRARESNPNLMRFLGSRTVKSQSGCHVHGRTPAQAAKLHEPVEQDGRNR